MPVRTQEAYVHAVRQLAAHFRRPPDRLTEDDLRQYFPYLANVKHFARASFTIALRGIKFFYERTLGHEWLVLGLEADEDAVRHDSHPDTRVVLAA